MTCQLDKAEHRPWPLPAGRWVMSQVWHDVLFAHWRVPAETLRAQIPAALKLDTIDGEAWIGVLPFRMTGVRLRGTPALPWLSAFPELNVRTYVRRDERPGVFFFSLDAGNRLAVAVARRWYHLPYFPAKMSLRAENDYIHYSSMRVCHREEAEARFVGSYRPEGEAKVGTLEHWLAERYCLYAADSRGRVYRGEIHHQPWLLQMAEAEIEVNSMTAPLSLKLPEERPLAHFARRQEAIFWPLRRVGLDPN